MSLPLIGRTIAGVGDGYVSAIYGELARGTTEDERTRYFAIIKGSHLMGIALGPSLNFFLKDFDFYIGNWHIDFRTSPGFFMAVMWTLVTGIMYVFAYDISEEFRKDKGYEQVSGEPCEEKLAKHRQLRQAYGIESPGDEHGQVTSSSAQANDVTKQEKLAEKELADESNEATTATLKDALVNTFGKFHVIVPVYSLFFAGILHTSLQAIVLLVATHMLNWSEINVAVLFTLWGVEIITVIIILWFLSPKISDRLLLLMSAIFGSLAAVSVFLLAFSSNRAYSLSVTIFLQGISLATVVVVGRSLVSKQTDPDNQAMAQAILAASNRTSYVLGPLVGVSLFVYQYTLASILSGSQILGLILVILAFKRFKT